MDIFDLVAKITLDSSDYDKGIKNSESKAHSFASSISSAVGGQVKLLEKGIGVISNTVGKAIDIGAKAVTAGSGAIAAFTTQSVKAYAEFEQLEGGVKKLFGTSSDQMMEYANQAYRTTGMSANQYMDTVTSFAASLIQSYGGDTAKAAEQADVAMRAISDNFNTFGGDITNIQNAFQGFAKQNYTMLDNLKLGYGGTEEEMKRLIEDANEYAAANGRAADLSIDSFGDIVEAIELIQEKQNIAGTTAKEASTTIAGSIGMMKAAWKNLVTGFTDPDADLDKLIGNVVDSIIGYTDELGNHVNGVLDNLIPAIERAVDGITRGIEKLAPVLGEKIPEIITNILPTMVSAGTELLSSLISGFTEPSVIKKLLFTVGDIVETLMNSLLEATEGHSSVILEVISRIIGVFAENYTQFIDIGAQILVNILEGMTLNNNLEYIAWCIGEILTHIIDVIIEYAPKLFDAATNIITTLAEGITRAAPTLIPKAVEVITTLTQTFWEHVGDLIPVALDLILALVQGILDSLPVVIDGAVEVISTIVSALVEHGPEILATGAQLIEMLILGVIKNAPKVVEAIAKIAKGMINTIIKIDWADVGKKTITRIHEGIEKLKAELPEALKKIGETAREFVKNIDWVELGKTIIKANIAGLKLMFYDIPKVMLEIGNAAVDAFLSIDWLQVGSDIINGIVDGIKGMGSAVWDAMKEGATGAWNGITDFFEISSPSKKMKWVGKMIDEGLAEGIEKNKKDVLNASDELVSDTWGELDTSSLTSNRYATTTSNNYASNNNISINVYGAAGQDTDELAEIIAEKLEDMEYRQQAAWGLV